jgi:hypothetical protein
MSTAGWKEARLLLMFALVGFLVAAFFTLTVFGGDRHAQSQASGSQVSRAAYVTSAQSGYRFSLSIGASAAGRSFTIDGHGSITPPNRGSIQMSAAGQQITELIDYPSLYMQLPSGSNPISTPWVKVNAAAVAQGASANGALGSTGDPAQWIAYLKAAGGVAVVDREYVRGVMTTRYHAVTDLDRYPSAVPPNLRSSAQQEVATLEKLTGQNTLPVDVWVDGQDRLRRIYMPLSIHSPTGAVTMTIDMQIYGYGPQPPVKLPDPAQVTDLTRQISPQSTSGLHVS